MLLCAWAASASGNVIAGHFDQPGLADDRALGIAALRAGRRGQGDHLSAQPPPVGSVANRYVAGSRRRSAATSERTSTPLPGEVGDVLRGEPDAGRADVLLQVGEAARNCSR